MNSNDMQSLARLLKESNHLAILTGAGISAESGLPTFRDPLTGLWANFHPEDLATPEAFQRDPEFVWQWYIDRRKMANQVKPNPGHYMIAWLAERVPKLTLITQNVDGLHQSAGSPKVIELHGNIHRSKCFRYGHPIEVELVDENSIKPPECPECGSLARPDVVWFGEILPEQELTEAVSAACSADLFLVIGTSGVVNPAASLSLTARNHRATVAVINPDPGAAIRGSLFLKGNSGMILPELAAETWGIDPSFFLKPE